MEKAAKKQYKDISYGKQDQSCDVLSKREHLLYLDTKDESIELILTHPDMNPYKIAISSGLECSWANSKHNLCVHECKSIVYVL